MSHTAQAPHRRNVVIPKVRSDPTLDGFMLASARGPQVWATRAGGHIQALAEPPPGPREDTAALLVEAIRDAYGEAAGDAAERELSEVTRRGGGLPSAVVRRLVEAAEASYSLLQGATYGLRLRYSAVASGAGFRACCEALGIDPRALPFARRRAIDAEVQDRLAGIPSPRAEVVADCLREVLARPLN